MFSTFSISRRSGRTVGRARNAPGLGMGTGGAPGGIPAAPAAPEPQQQQLFGFGSDSSSSEGSAQKDSLGNADTAPASSALAGLGHRAVSGTTEDHSGPKAARAGSSGSSKQGSSGGALDAALASSADDAGGFGALDSAEAGSCGGSDSVLDAALGGSADDGFEAALVDSVISIGSGESDGALDAALASSANDAGGFGTLDSAEAGSCGGSDSVLDAALGGSADDGFKGGRTDPAARSEPGESDSALDAALAGENSEGSLDLVSSDSGSDSPVDGQRAHARDSSPEPPSSTGKPHASAAGQESGPVPVDSSGPSARRILDKGVASSGPADGSMERRLAFQGLVHTIKEMLDTIGQSYGCEDDVREVAYLIDRLPTKFNVSEQERLVLAERVAEVSLLAEAAQDPLRSVPQYNTPPGYFPSKQSKQARYKFWSVRDCAVRRVLGARPSLQDSYVVFDRFASDKDSGFFAVYDGHGGPASASIAGTTLHHIVADRLSTRQFPDVGETATEPDPHWTGTRVRFAMHAAGEQDVGSTVSGPDATVIQDAWTVQVCALLRESILTVDTSLTTLRLDSDGTTVCACLILPVPNQPGTRRLFFANVGDTEAVLITRDPENPGSFGHVLASVRHNPASPEELQRVTQSGARVKRVDRTARLSIAGCSIAVTRAVGDHIFRQLCPALTPFPDFYVCDIVPGFHTHIVIGSDGVWDSIKEAHKDVVRIVTKAATPREAADGIIDRVIDCNPHDNTTVIVCEL